MAEPFLAVNTQHSGDPRRDHRGYAEPYTGEQLDGLLSEEWLRQMVAGIRGGREELKDLLPYACPHYSRFRNNHRAQKDIIPEAFTYMTCVDVDDLELVEPAIARTRELIADDLSDWQELILRMEYSARRKLHIWLRLPVGKTISETQADFCQEIGIPRDESAETPERFMFLTGADEEIYRSERWMKPLSEQELEERREAFLMRGLDVDGRPLVTASPKEAETQAPTATATAEQTACDVVKATERTLYIFRECMKEEEVTDRDLTEKGARHTSLKMVLSNCMQLLTQGEVLGVLEVVMPGNWQDENIRQLVADFYSKYYDPSQRLTLMQKRVFRESRRIADTTQADATQGGQAATGAAPQGLESTDSLTRLFASKTPPEMPAALPRLVKLVTRNTPQKYKPAVAQAMFPPLATYPQKLQFVYTDNQVRELRINCLIVAETGSGKDACTKQPLEHLLADMKARDEENRRRLEQYNEAYNNKANTKEKPKRPDDLIIQTIKSDVTKAALVQRMCDAREAPLYVKLNELEQWDQVECCSGRKNHFTTMKILDDEYNDFGADRAGTQSVNGSGNLHLNWNANTTPGKVLDYFKYVVTDGPISRLCLATITDDTELGADIEVFGDYDEAYDEALKPYIANLKAATGKIDCQQARRMARKLKEECAEFARLSQDHVFDNLSHRALVHVFRKACLLYAANGMKWEKAIETFCRWSLYYDLYLKMMLWADSIRQANQALPTLKRGPRSLLDLLPDEFTMEDAQGIRRKSDLSAEGTGNMVSTWKKRNYVVQMADGSFKKSEVYLMKIGRVTVKK